MNNSHIGISPYKGIKITHADGDHDNKINIRGIIIAYTLLIVMNINSNKDSINRNDNNLQNNESDSK